MCGSGLRQEKQESYSISRAFLPWPCFLVVVMVVVVVMNGGGGERMQAERSLSLDFLDWFSRIHSTYPTLHNPLIENIPQAN